MTILTIDIETVPTQLAWVRDDIAATIKAPGTLKKPESIAEWERESKPAAVEEAVQKTSFDGTYGQIVCIGWAIDDDDPQSEVVRDLSPDQERALLRSVFSAWSRAASATRGTRPTIVAHNAVGFDIPFIWKRCIVHGIRPPFFFPRDPKPWADTVFDTMTQWSGTKDKISLDRLCKALGLEGKAGMTGADVWPAAQAGEWDRIAEYCRDDVRLHRAVWRRMTFAELPA